MKQVPYWGSTNIRCHCTKCSHHGKLASGICTPLTYVPLGRQESLLGIVTRLWAVQAIFPFSTSVQSGSGSHPLSYSMYTRACFLGYSSWNMRVTGPVPLVWKHWLCGAVSVIPHMKSVCGAWLITGTNFTSTLLEWILVLLLCFFHFFLSVCLSFFPSLSSSLYSFFFLSFPFLFNLLVIAQ
jgi:hypothetical protein